MGLEQEKYQVYFLIEKLGNCYPDKLDRIMIETLKRNIASQKNFEIIKKDLELVIKDPNQLEKFLIKYQGATEGLEVGQNQEMKHAVGMNRVTKKPMNHSHEYSREELIKITEGMTEEEIVTYLRLHGKNPSQIMMALLMLEEEKTKDFVSEKPKQMVLKNGNTKIAAFINNLYLVFLVGMASGAFFFLMLQIILHAL